MDQIWGNLCWVYGPKAINKSPNCHFDSYAILKPKCCLTLQQVHVCKLTITVYTELQRKWANQWVHLRLFVACASACILIVCCWDSCDIESWYWSCLTLQQVNTEICSGRQVIWLGLNFISVLRSTVFSTNCFVSGFLFTFLCSV